MLSDPIPSEPTTPDPRAENAQYYLRILHRLIELGASLAERIQQQPVNKAEATTAGIEPSATATSVEFDRTVRGVRRSILMAQHIQTPAPARAAADPAPRNATTWTPAVPEGPTLPANDGEAVAMLLQGDARLPV